MVPSSSMSETLEQRAPTPPGRHVAAERVRAGLTQEQAAKLLEMDRSRLSQIETGVIAPGDIRVDEVRRFQKVVGLDPLVWFVEESGRAGD